MTFLCKFKKQKSLKQGSTTQSYGKTRVFLTLVIQEESEKRTLLTKMKKAPCVGLSSSKPPTLRKKTPPPRVIMAASSRAPRKGFFVFFWLVGSSIYDCKG